MDSYKIEVRTCDLVPDGRGGLRGIDGLVDVEQAWALEDEACEVVGALEGREWADARERRGAALSELCDVLTAACGLLRVLGVTQGELDAALAECEARQRERGRIVG